jgi:hypothetical protein
VTLVILDQRDRPERQDPSEIQDHKVLVLQDQPEKREKLGRLGYKVYVEYKGLMDKSDHPVQPDQLVPPVIKDFKVIKVYKDP